MTLTLTIDGRPAGVDTFSYSNVDPGGCEQLQATLPDGRTVQPDARVVVRDGLQPIWAGAVEEPGQHSERGAASTGVAAVGDGAALKDGVMTMVYIDQDLNAWGSPSRTRQLWFLDNGFATQSHEVSMDQTNGKPSLALIIQGAWTTASRPVCQPQYDSGAGNLLAVIRGTWTRSSAIDSGDASWAWDLTFSTTDDTGAGQGSGSLRAAGPDSIEFRAKPAARYCAAGLAYYGGGAGGADNYVYRVDWTDLRVFGDHGLPIFTDTVGDGLDPADIVRHALALSRSGLKPGRIESAPGVLVRQLAYKQMPIAHEQPLLDMATLAGYHVGTWPGSLLDGTSQVDFCARPNAPTVYVRRSECENVDLAERRSGLHDRAVAHYQLAAGGGDDSVTVERSNPRLIGDRHRTLTVDAGIVGSRQVAEARAMYELALDQIGARAGGSIVLPSNVLTPGGGLRPSHTLQAGRDRLGLIGGAGQGAMIGDAPARIVSFRVARVTVDVQSGVPKTTVELDAGAALTESLTAQIAQAQAVSGT